MEQALIAYLLADGGLSALVSTRVYWARRPQEIDTLPAVVLFRIGGVRDTATDGATGLVESGVQADIYGETYGAAKEAAAALISALNAYSGTTGGVAFQGVFVDGERDDNDVESQADARRLFRTSVDLTVWHDE